jgi:hypothetical protein
MSNNLNSNILDDKQYEMLKKRANCEGHPLKCLPSVFVSQKGTDEVIVRCAREEGTQCPIMPVYNVHST